MQKFDLSGEVFYERGGAGNPDKQGIFLTFSAENLEQAKIIVRAMMESVKNRIQKRYECINKMYAVLYEVLDEGEKELWEIEFVPEKEVVVVPAQTKIVSEHFEDWSLS